MTDTGDTVTGCLAADPVAAEIWRQRYRAPGEHGIEQSWSRVASALADGDVSDALPTFRAALEDFRFLPGGRILAGAGRAGHFTLQNCFVLGQARDGASGLARLVAEAARTLERGGGIGCDFSPLRPEGSPARSAGTLSPGPLGAMRTLDALCANLFAGRARPGAMMATLRCDHPDIERFVEAKREAGALGRFNVSVLVTDTLMRAAAAGERWPLVFPRAGLAGDGGNAPLISRPLGDGGASVVCRVFAEIDARALLARIARTAWDCAEPGVLFVDRINAWNNLYWCEHISATNPCGEEPLPPHGACNLGSINLTRLVREPFTRTARLDLPALEETAASAVRMLDATIGVSRYALAAQRREALAKRRIGLGLTGLADALLMLGLHYDSDAGRALAARAMRSICHAAYRQSVALARERGPFPVFAREPFLAGRFVARLPADLRDAIARHGLRNSHLTAIAPAGTISVLAGNLSSGIEPVFAAEYRRLLRRSDGSSVEVAMCDHAVALWRARHGGGLPPAFVGAAELTVEAHLAMAAALQPWVDAAISKTINLPEDTPFEGLAEVYSRAHALGLKGCTVFRPNPIRGAVLAEGFHCAAGADCEPV